MHEPETQTPDCHKISNTRACKLWRTADATNRAGAEAGGMATCASGWDTIGAWGRCSASELAIISSTCVHHQCRVDPGVPNIYIH